jgi:large subunit ribosomal protein L25
MDSRLIFPFLGQKINQILYSSLISIQNKWQFWGFHRRLICAIFHVVLIFSVKSQIPAMFLSNFTIEVSCISQTIQNISLKFSNFLLATSVEKCYNNHSQKRNAEFVLLRTARTATLPESMHQEEEFDMITLKAEKRNPNVKAKKLRREGYVTGILSGKEMKEPVALQFDAAEAAKFIKANKEGTQIYLDIEGEKVDALVKNIDYNPIEKQLMALDFQALVAGEKVSTTVAVKLEHTELVQGIVEQEMEEIHYKADPANLLDTIVIDFNGYPADVRDIHVKDLPIPEGKQVHFITPEDAVVVHIGEYEATPEEDEDAEGAETEAK